LNLLGNFALAKVDDAIIYYHANNGKKENRYQENVYMIATQKHKLSIDGSKLPAKIADFAQITKFLNEKNAFIWKFRRKTLLLSSEND
jgi:hypothetical protein